MNIAPHAARSAAPNSLTHGTRRKVAPSVLVIDDSSLCRELVCVALRGQGFVIASATDGQAGLIQLEKGAPDLVLLDNEMPKMGGLEFLKALRADARWKNIPVIMLTTTTSKDVILEASRLGISSYVLKERFSMPEMLSRVGQALSHGRGHGHGAAQAAHAPHAVDTPGPAATAAAEPPAPKPNHPAIAKMDISSMQVPNLVTRDATLAGLAEIESAKSLAGVVGQIATISASAKANIGEISAVVRQDPILATRIIQLAASAAYAGSKTRVASVDDAVRVVGVSAVRDLAATASVFKAFPADRSDGMDLLRCWQHAFAASAVMTRIVPKSDSTPPGLPHLLGLCHDLGEILLRQRFPTEFAGAMDYARQAQAPVYELLPQVFGISYAELMKALLEKMKFPSVVTEPIEQFAAYVGSPLDAHDRMLPRSLAIADFLAHGMLLGSSAQCLIMPIAQNDCRSALISSSELNTGAIRSEAITTVSMLANLGSDQAAALSKPLCAHREVNVLYLRPSQFAPLDPLAAALASLAEVRIVEHLGKYDELHDIHGLVVLAPPSGESPLPDVLRACAQSGAHVPILSLTARSDGEHPPVQRAGVENMTYPLSINQLAQFISRLNTPG